MEVWGWQMFLAKNPRLLTSFKKGERAAMDLVYRHYFAGVTAFLRKGFTFKSGRGFYFFKGIQDPSDLKAAVQEVFRRAFEDKARTSYNGVNSFTNWVLAIARNMVINQFRNREIAFSDYVSPTDERGHLVILDEEMKEEFSGVLYAEHTQAQDMQLEDSELKGLVETFMAKLSANDRQLLLLRFVEGKGQEETALLLNSTRMKVRTAEARLRSRLRAYMRPSGYIDNVLLASDDKDSLEEEFVLDDEDLTLPEKPALKKQKTHVR